MAMLLRALFILLIVIGLSVAATLYFGDHVLIALGLILIQIKLLFKKVLQVELALVVAWFKMHGPAFLKSDLPKKWITGSVLPLLLGKPLMRRIGAWTNGLRADLRRRYMGLMRWYRALGRVEKAVAWLIVLFATVALSVSSIGLWLILFSVKLPFWFVAFVAAIGVSALKTVEKMMFRTIALLQLGWLWRLIKWALPPSLLERKRRFDYRVARAVVRRRRMTASQLADRKDSLPFRLGLIAEYWRQPPGA